MGAPKHLFIFYNSFSLWLTENLHKQKHYLHVFLYYFSVKCIIKKNYLLPHGPLKGTVPVEIRFLAFFLNVIKIHYGVGNNVQKFQVSTMKIVPVAHI